MEVEAVQLIAGLLGIHYVLIDNECRSLCVVGDTLADLAAESQYSSRGVGSRGLPNGAEFAKEVKEFFGCDVVAATSQYMSALHPQIPLPRTRRREIGVP